MKTCKKCLIEKDTQFFGNCTKAKDKLQSYCKQCYVDARSSNYQKYKARERENHRQYKKNNPDKFKKYKHDYYLKNKETVNLKSKKYRENNKEKVLETHRKYTSNKIKTDPFFKIKRNLRNRLYYALKREHWQKNTHFAEYIGCDKETLINHLESQFKSNMSWNNYGSVWHIDHIKALGFANTPDDLYKLCHYTNLQPLLIEEHKLKTTIDNKGIFSK